MVGWGGADELDAAPAAPNAVAGLSSGCGCGLRHAVHVMVLGSLCIVPAEGNETAAQQKKNKVDKYDSS